MEFKIECFSVNIAFKKIFEKSSKKSHRSWTASTAYSSIHNKGQVIETKRNETTKWNRKEKS